MNTEEEFKEALAKRVANGAFNLATFIMERADYHIVQKDLQDTGDLRKTRDIESDGSGLNYTLIYRMPYAPWIEYGTDPHPVSEEGMEKIAKWCRHKLGKGKKESERMAAAIAWKIYHYGSDPKPFMRPAIQDGKAEAQRIFQEALNRR